MAEHKGGGDLMRFSGMDLGLEGGSTGVSWPATATTELWSEVMGGGRVG
jgi:hypothetical protein